MSITGARLRELREETGKSQGEIAKLIGISRPAYVAYETGRSNPSRKIKQLSSLFNVSADYILGRSDYRTSPQDETSEFGAMLKKAHEKEKERARLQNAYNLAPPAIRDIVDCALSPYFDEE